MYFTRLAVNTAFAPTQAETRLAVHTAFAPTQAESANDKKASHHNSFSVNKIEKNINGLQKSKWTVNNGSGVSTALICFTLTFHQDSLT